VAARQQTAPLRPSQPRLVAAGRTGAAGLRIGQRQQAQQVASPGPAMCRIGAAQQVLILTQPIAALTKPMGSATALLLSSLPAGCGAVGTCVTVHPQGASMQAQDPLCAEPGSSGSGKDMQQKDPTRPTHIAGA